MFLQEMVYMYGLVLIIVDMKENGKLINLITKEHLQVMIWVMMVVGIEVNLMTKEFM